MTTNTLQYKDYIGTVNYSSEDDVLFGKIIGINDIIMFEGSSVQELKKAFEEAVEDYLETCKELNKSPEKTYKGSFNVRINSELHRKAAYLASQSDISLNELVGNAIQFYLSKVETGTSGSILYLSKDKAMGTQDAPPIVCVGADQNIAYVSHSET